MQSNTSCPVAQNKSSPQTLSNALVHHASTHPCPSLPINRQAAKPLTQFTMLAHQMLRLKCSRDGEPTNHG